MLRFNFGGVPFFEATIVDESTGAGTKARTAKKITLLFSFFAHTIFALSELCEVVESDNLLLYVRIAINNSNIGPPFLCIFAFRFYGAHVEVLVPDLNDIPIL